MGGPNLIAYYQSKRYNIGQENSDFLRCQTCICLQYYNQRNETAD